MNVHVRRLRADIGRDLETQMVRFDQVRRIMELTSDYVGERPRHIPVLETDENIMAFLAGGLALLRETLAGADRIESELRQGTYDADTE